MVQCLDISYQGRVEGPMGLAWSSFKHRDTKYSITDPVSYDILYYGSFKTLTAGL